MNYKEKNKRHINCFMSALERKNSQKACFN